MLLPQRRAAVQRPAPMHSAGPGRAPAHCVRTDRCRRRAAEGCCAAHVHYMHRPALVMAWLHELLMQRQQDGGLEVPAPILSRAYQILSDAVNSYDHCRCAQEHAPQHGREALGGLVLVSLAGIPELATPLAVLSDFSWGWYVQTSIQKKEP
jgi:hypothetical protein